MSEKGLLSHPLTYDEIMDSAKDVIQKCHVLLPGKSNVEKKNWCVKKLTEVLEVFDNYVPIIGALLDIAIVDDLEKQAVSLLVDWVWEKFVEQEEESEKNSPEDK